ncbi:hypothetical protein ACEXQD_04485 [Herbiconiux sp. P15]|uniref:hypothetical protein n=1 Tax=Herbiconiux liukaitaii TaxID=3342799 RepID=UPI0035B99410
MSGDGATASARARRRERFGPDAAERISAGCYGALVAATTLIGLTETPMGSLILVVVLTNLIYYATHVFAYTIGAPGGSGEAGWPAVRHHLVVSAPMVSVTFVPIALVVVLDLAGVDRETAVLVGVMAALAYLVAVATGGAFVRGLRPLAVLLVGVLTFAIAIALVAAKLSLH